MTQGNPQRGREMRERGGCRKSQERMAESSDRLGKGGVVMP